jgi:hypothetical protein
MSTVATAVTPTLTLTQKVLGTQWARVSNLAGPGLKAVQETVPALTQCPLLQTEVVVIQ